jgi:predicted transcriptional regulator
MARTRKPKVVSKTGRAAPKPRPRRVVAKTGLAPPKRRSGRVAKAGHLTVMEVAELDDLRRQLQRTARAQSPLRWNADPDDVQRSVAQLVLTLVEFVRQLLERQSIRRMEAGTLTDRQVEDVGRALMQLEETVRDIAAKFGIPPEDLNLELGPFGKLL